VTLFALIFSIGILVDDAIVVVENIARHARMPENAGRGIVKVAIEAVDEVGNPTILATLDWQGPTCGPSRSARPRRWSSRSSWRSS
jgi:hypothetical protein